MVYNYAKDNIETKPDFKPTRNQPDDPNEHLCFLSLILDETHSSGSKPGYFCVKGEV